MGIGNTKATAETAHASYQDYAIVGTKGYTFEGPFYMRGKKHIPKQDDYISTVMEEVATDQDYSYFFKTPKVRIKLIG